MENELVNKKYKSNNVEFGHSISLPERDTRISIVENSIDNREKYSVSTEVIKNEEEVKDNTVRAR